MIATISKDVPGTAINAIMPMFDQLRNNSNTTHPFASPTRSKASNFDWAIHPGGATILQGARQALHLTDDHIRASLEVYQNYGNSSSPTVLIVLDKLRQMGEGRENVVATSFGPGLTIEMCMMKRCRHVATTPSSADGEHTKMYALWLSLHLRLSKRWARVHPRALKGTERRTSAYIPIVQ
jgi:type III polyketide synthase